MDHPIKCDKCGGDKFTIRMLSFSKWLFFNCDKKGCGGVYLIGGRNQFKTADDLQFIRKTILFRRF